MSRLTRLTRLALTTLLAIAAVGPLAQTSLAAGATTDTVHDTFRLIEDHAPNEQYIFDVKAVGHTTIRPDGVQSLTYAVRQVQTHVLDGIVVDVISSSQAGHALLDGEDAVVVHTTLHARYEGDGMRCTTSTVWQFVKDELLVSHFASHCH